MKKIKDPIKKNLKKQIPTTQNKTNQKKKMSTKNIVRGARN